MKKGGTRDNVRLETHTCARTTKHPVTRHMLHRARTQEGNNGRGDTHNYKIRGTGAETIGIGNRIHRKELHCVSAVLRRLSEHVLRDERTMFLLQRRSDLFRVLRLLQVRDQVDFLDLVDIVEAATAEEFAQNDFRTFKARDALLECRVDNPRMFTHVLGGAAGRLPCLLADLGRVQTIVTAHASRFVRRVFCLCLCLALSLLGSRLSCQCRVRRCT